MKNVLILGANGMLGHALTSVFADAQLTLWDKDEADITDAKVLLERICSAQPDVIINAAAYTDVDGCEDHFELAYAVNATAVKNITDAAKACSARVVHYSTDYVFPGINKRGYTENDEPDPINAYGRTKLDGERFLTASGVPFLLIRTQWLYGPYGKNFVDTIVQKAKEVPKLTVVNDQYGSPTYTVDLARHTRMLIESGADGIHHATNSGVTSWHGFAKEIVNAAGLSTPVIAMSSDKLLRKAQRPAYSALRNTKDQNLRSWQEAVRDYLLHR